MTDSEFFEERVKLFFMLCWRRRYITFFVFLVLTCIAYLSIGLFQHETYQSRIQFSAADYDLWSENFYSIEAASIFLRDYSVISDSDGQYGDPSRNTFLADISAEAAQSADGFAAMLLAKVPRARLANNVAEIRLTTKGPGFVDKIFYPMVYISRQMFIDAGREAETRANKVFDEVLRGNLSQVERETIDEDRVKLRISTIVGESDVASAINTREIEKNTVATISLADHIKWTIILSMLSSTLVLLAFFLLERFFTSRDMPP